MEAFCTGLRRVRRKKIGEVAAGSGLYKFYELKVGKA